LKGLKDEKQKFMNEFNTLQENERQLKRERKLNFKKDYIIYLLIFFSAKLN